MSGLAMTGAGGRILEMPTTDILFLMGKCFFSPIETVGKITKLIKGNLSPMHSAVTSAAGTGKLVIGIAGFPESILKFGKAVKQVFVEPGLYNVKEAFMKFASMGGPLNDTYDFIFKHVTEVIPSSVTTFVKGISPIGMVLVSTDSGIKNAIDITKEVKNGVNAMRAKNASKSGSKDATQATNDLINAGIRGSKVTADAISAACYFVLGVALLVAFWLAAVPAWLLVIPPAIALVAILASKWIDKLFVQSIPEEKTKVMLGSAKKITNV
ncbi:MAG: hypothetical protein V4494_00290 [Chlamydiota bacterium]